MPRDPKLETPIQRILAMRTGGWFRSHMDSYYEQSEEPRIDPGWFHPSALNHPCDAFLAFQFLGLTQPRGAVSSKLRRIFDNGHSTEGRWQVAIQRAGIALLGKEKGDRNFEIPQYRIRGELDNIVVHPQTGEKWVWDCKTMREDLYDKLKAPLPGWVIQMHCYMFGVGILQSMVMVECKNCQEYKEFTFGFDGVLWRGVTDRVERILERLGQRQEIARTPIPKDSSCPFYPVCAGFDFSKGASR